MLTVHSLRPFRALLLLRRFHCFQLAQPLLKWKYVSIMKDETDLLLLAFRGLRLLLVYLNIY